MRVRAGRHNRRRHYGAGKMQFSVCTLARIDVAVNARMGHRRLCHRRRQFQRKENSQKSLISQKGLKLGKARADHIGGTQIALLHHLRPREPVDRSIPDRPTLSLVTAISSLLIELSTSEAVERPNKQKNCLEGRRQCERLEAFCPRIADRV
jgi:hypothetical protein